MRAGSAMKHKMHQLHVGRRQVGIINAYCIEPAAAFIWREPALACHHRSNCHFARRRLSSAGA